LVRHRIIVLGTGFSGLCVGVKRRAQGEEDFVLLERTGGVGDTRRDSTYPGCACDVESHRHSFSFESNPNGSQLNALQPEIFAYLKHVATKCDLLRHVRFHAKLVGVRCDDARKLWAVTTEDGHVFEGEVLVSGMGGLSNPAIPHMPGLSTCKGKAFHSATWHHGHTLNDQGVTVIGSGASAIQFVPAIAPKVARHRTRKHIRDPALQAKLPPDCAPDCTPERTPRCKRLLISNDHHPALTRTNVEVITEGICKVVPHGVIPQDDRLHQVDTIVYGTGFKVQDPTPQGTVLGRGGRDMADAWQDGPEAHMGIAVAGFPNFFMLMAPNAGLDHNSMVFMIGSQAHCIVEALRAMKEERLQAIEVKPEVQQRFGHKVRQPLQGTVRQSGCKSWYIHDQGRHTTLRPGFTFAYRLKTHRSKLSQYRTEPA
jgi:cation diffusion facilitator CzcD-associated flavoprotein CzcO